MTLLKVEQLALTIGHERVIKNVSFGVARGETLALVGESGSGKSLTALSCLGLQPPAARVSGSICFEGSALLHATDATWRGLRGNRIGMIFQEPMTALNPLHSIGQQISEAITLHQKLSRRAVKAQVITLLEQVGLGHFAKRLHHYPHELSGGERQRVMIAMAIANKPALLIADEPTTALDVTVQAKILDLLRALQRSLDMAILFITHDLTIVRKLADRVAVMQQGEIVEQGNASELFAAPRHAYTQTLLASAPRGVPLLVANDASILLSCQALTVHYAVRQNWFSKNVSTAVNNVSLTLAQGSTLGIVGESGSGKTTLGLALLRLVKSDGAIMFQHAAINGLTRKQLRPVRRRLQVVFQDPYSSLNPRMNVEQLLSEGLLVHEPQLTFEQRTLRVDAVLQEVGLQLIHKQRYPHEFSGGQRQRLNIARALILRPDCIILDEPTSALDVSMQAQILTLLKNLQERYNLSYIFISHDLQVIKVIAHTVCVLYQGNIVEQGNTEHIFSNPQDEYTKTLLRAVPTLA